MFPDHNLDTRDSHCYWVVISSLFLKIFISCIYFWPGWVFTASYRLSLVAASRGYPHGVVLWLLDAATPLVAEHRFSGAQPSAAVTCGLNGCSSQALETGSGVGVHRLRSWGSRAQLLHGMWDRFRPGNKPMSPALADRFSTAGPPGKPRFQCLWVDN